MTCRQELGEKHRRRDRQNKTKSKQTLKMAKRKTVKGTESYIGNKVRRHRHGLKMDRGNGHRDTNKFSGSRNADRGN